MDFESLRHFKDKFYHILKEKEVKRQQQKMGEENMQNEERDDK